MGKGRTRVGNDYSAPGRRRRVRRAEAIACLQEMKAKVVERRAMLVLAVAGRTQRLSVVPGR